MDNAVLFHCYCGGNLREALPAAHGAAPVSVSAVAGGGKKYLIPHGTVVQSEAAVAALRVAERVKIYFLRRLKILYLTGSAEKAG